LIILNFSHPLTAAQCEKIEALARQPIDLIYDLPVQFDNDRPFTEQIEALAGTIPLESDRLQSEPILINLPSLNYIAVGLVAWLNGRMGYFPAILRLKGNTEITPMVYEVAEIINLQSLRDLSRRKR